MWRYLQWLGVCSVLLGGLGLGVHPAAAQTLVAAEAGAPLAARGPYTNQGDHHWDGRYHVLRTGTQVTATLTTRRSPIQRYARQNPQPLLWLPEGYRPLQQVTWTVAAAHVTAQGEFQPGAPAVPVTLTAQPDGAVHYVDGPDLDQVGHVAYTALMTWDTAEVALMTWNTAEVALFPETDGSVEDSIEQYRLEYRLERRGSAVSATVFFPTNGTYRKMPIFIPMGFRTLWASTTAFAETEEGVIPYRSLLRGSSDPITIRGVKVRQLQWLTEDPVPTDGRYALSSRPADVCWRLAAVQRALMDALTTAARSPVSCDQATWADLASLQTMVLKLYGDGDPAGPRALLPYDLAGLTHLRELQIHNLDERYRYPLPPAMLLYTPELQTLQVTTGHKRLPADLLVYAPQLRKLEIGQAEALPAGLLTYVPQLQEIKLTGSYSLTALPPDFLAYTPRLQTLTLDTPSLTALPADFLTHHAPRLQTLTLDTPSLTTLPPDFLAHAPQLQTLTLDTPNLTALSPDFLAHAPRLQTLTLDTPNLTALPPDFLAHVPQLQTLTLDTPNLTALPPDFLAHAPQLRMLTLAGSNLTALPPDFLAHAPRLQTLTLDIPSLTAALPPDFLAHAPQLRMLTLAGPNLTALPPDFLAHAPRLQTLTLDIPSLTAALPPDFLTHAPRLQTLTLDIPSLTAALPPDFLAHAPRLTKLFLDVSVLELPPDFLVHTPQLQTLTLAGPNLTALPPDSLVHAPQLRRLTWHAKKTTLLLSPDLPDRLPALRYVHLSLGGSTDCNATTERNLERLVGAELLRYFLDRCPLLNQIQNWERLMRGAG